MLQLCMEYKKNPTKHYSALDFESEHGKNTGKHYIALNFEVLATLTILNMNFIKILTKLAVFLNEQKIHIHAV